MKEIIDAPNYVYTALSILKEDLDAHIPAKKVDRNILIATWNIRAFGDFTPKWNSDKGDSPKRDIQSIIFIAEIISRFDVVAVQEGNFQPDSQAPPL
ncbi:MAG: hypothetical protein ACI840_002621 [Ulvibacter sp.]|jgi:hypothetical protein